MLAIFGQNWSRKNRERRDDCMSWLHFPIKAHSNDYHFVGTLCCFLIIIIKGILYVGIALSLFA